MPECNGQRFKTPVLLKWPRTTSCECKILQFLNDTKKATKLGMIVFRAKQCFNTQFAHMSSAFCPDRQALLMPLLEQQLSFHGSISKFHPSQLNFHLTKTSPFKKILMPLSLFKMIVISNTPTASTWHWFPKETSQTVLSISISSELQLPSRNYFKIFKITLTAILTDIVKSSKLI